MKKYVKPALYFESFDLSQNISACGFDMNSTESLHCEAVGDPEFLWPKDFRLLHEWCYMPLDETMGDLICYETGANPEPGYRIFNS